MPFSPATPNTKFSLVLAGRVVQATAMKGVFDLKLESGYDDDIARRYHFPATRPYREAALACVGDWIVYRESRRNGGRASYVGAAQVVAVEPDPNDATHAYARVENFLPVPTLVPLRIDGVFAEGPLRGLPDPSKVGAALQGRSVRPLAEGDFAAIVNAGLTETLAPANAVRLGLDFPAAEPPSYLAPGWEEDSPRRVEQMLLNRKVRDANFRLVVCDAYDNRCAVTGLRIINGGGRAEVQAAHIQPVANDGPDVVQNGLALSATVHWLFDRHLISIGEDHRLLVAHNRVPTELVNLFRPSDQPIHMPSDPRLRPHSRFLAHHRERFARAGLG
jgi:putative restriction endonuclease